MVSAQEMMESRSAMLVAGRYDLLVEEYFYPLTIYLPGKPPTSATPQTVWGFFQTFHAALVAGGMSVLTARVAAQGLPHNGRSQLWTDWYGEGAGLARRLVAQTVCYLRDAPSGRRTEILEFTRLDLPMLAAA